MSFEWRQSFGWLSSSPSSSFFFSFFILQMAFCHWNQCFINSILRYWQWFFLYMLCSFSSTSFTSRKSCVSNDLLWFISFVFSFFFSCRFLASSLPEEKQKNFFSDAWEEAFSTPLVPWWCWWWWYSIFTSIQCWMFHFLTFVPLCAQQFSMNIQWT